MIFFIQHIKCNPTKQERKINHFLAHLRGLALKFFKDIERTTTKILAKNLVVFRRKCVKPEPSASAKHRFHRLVFGPERQQLRGFLEEFQESAKKPLVTSQMIESLLYAKMPSHLKRSFVAGGRL